MTIETKGLISRLMAAVDPRTGEIYVVETDQGEFEAACALAKMVGIEVGGRVKQAWTESYLGGIEEGLSIQVSARQEEARDDHRWEDKVRW